MSITKLEQSHIDLYRVRPLNPNRLVAFINHMVIRTTQQLNQLVLTVDTRLERINTKINQCQANLTVLETKLNSVPGLVVNIDRPASTTVQQQPSTATQPDQPSASATVNPVQVSSTSQTTVPTHQQNGHAHQPSTLESSGSSAGQADQQQSQMNGVGDSVSSSGDQNGGQEAETEAVVEEEVDPRLAKYTRMLSVGVPFPAVQQKMLTEGLDPTLLQPK